ncbi:hypothetical protein B6228_01720 [Candidatus Atribacteria bacterium 4572_76]|nr:MAG: hypothetical protein B6228_01720 [Candidatus Atribacteria bacterium 4572_76]
MFFYKLKDRILISQSEYSELNRISESEAKESKEIIYILNRINPLKSRRYFSITDPSLFFLKEEGIHLLQKSKKIDYDLPLWLNPFTDYQFPEVYQLREENIFDCDMFVFCATVGVPSLGEEQEDVRMKQFEGNSKIISDYARKAREKSFKGIFAIISDPVDLLCKAVFLTGNKDASGEFDFKGLAADQIRGYGLGVMHARAVYYSKQNTETAEYNREGRAFGPHGRGLVIANSLKKYDESLSEMLTAQTVKANLEVRKTGFKPYIAPALSSGSYPLIATMSGKWHYSATFMGGVFMGAKNRLIKSGTEIERLNLPDILVEKIKKSYQELGNIL